MQARKEMINMQNAKLAYTVEEASKSTGIGKNTLRNLIEWKKNTCNKGRQKVSY